MTGEICEVAALLPSAICEIFAAQCPGCTISCIDNPAMIPPTAKVLLALPNQGLAEQKRPSGWPFGIRWVHLLTSGLDRYPDWFLRDVPTTHSPGASAVPLAEYCLAAILSHARRLDEIAITSPEQWVPKPSTRVQGTTLGLVGFGAIASAIATRARAFGMEVRVFRRSDRPLPAGVMRASGLHDLFAKSDHVVLAVPATPETKGMIDAEVLASAREGQHLINVARGNLIDDAALLNALDRGRIARASLDVTDPEPLPAGHPFYTHPRVSLTPHAAAFDNESLPDLIAMFRENMRRMNEKEPLLWHISLGHGDDE